MNPAIYICVFLPILIAIIESNKRKRALIHKRIKERRIKNMAISNDLIKELINKECTISTGTWGTSYKGVIEKVEDEWIKINTGKKIVILSLDYIMSIEQKK